MADRGGQRVMLRPYFERDGVTLYHASCMDLMATMAPRSVGCTITDPPYTDRVHDGARSNRRLPQIRKEGGGPMRPIDFPSVTDEMLRAAFVEMGRLSRRWVIATTAFEHAARMYDDPPDGLRPIRVGAWTKTNPMPQITGDRPTQGWEAVSIQYADTCRPHWNGGGRPATYIGPSRSPGVERRWCVRGRPDIRSSGATSARRRARSQRGG